LRLRLGLRLRLLPRLLLLQLAQTRRLNLNYLNYLKRPTHVLVNCVKLGNKGGRKLLFVFVFAAFAAVAKSLLSGPNISMLFASEAILY
jgi:hypothetical protein